MNAAITTRILDHLLAWLNDSSRSSTATIVKKELGIDANGSTSSEETMTTIVRELILANTAILVYAIGKVFDAKAASSLTDAFLPESRKRLAATVADQDTSIRAIHESRISEYLAILRRGEQGAGMSIAFIRHLNLETTSSKDAQLNLAYRFDMSLNKASAFFGRFNAAVK